MADDFECFSYPADPLTDEQLAERHRKRAEHERSMAAKKADDSEEYREWRRLQAERALATRMTVGELRTLLAEVDQGLFVRTDSDRDDDGMIRNFEVRNGECVLTVELELGNH